MAIEGKQTHQSQQLYLVDTETGSVRPFGSPQSMRDPIRNLGIHPDGKRIVFTSLKDGDLDIYVMASDDHGATWTALPAEVAVSGVSLVRVNDDNSGTSQFFSWIGVDATTGNVAVSWYDAREDAAGTPANDDPDNVDGDTDGVGDASAVGAATGAGRAGGAGAPTSGADDDRPSAVFELHDGFEGTALASDWARQDPVRVGNCDQRTSEGLNSVHSAPSMTRFMKRSGIQLAVFMSCVRRRSSPVFLRSSRNSSMSRCQVSR